jgi:hypothetical protein
MSKHPTDESAASGTVLARAGEPADDATATSAFADLVCADHDLLHAEFDAIITANFRCPAEDPEPPGSAGPLLTGTATIPRQRAPAGFWHRPRRSGRVGTRHPHARARGPPLPLHGHRGQT